jgi:hypothetical protein
MLEMVLCTPLFDVPFINFHLLCVLLAMPMGYFTLQALIYIQNIIIWTSARHCALRLPTFSNSLATNAGVEPICIATRVRGKKHQNIFCDDRGFPDQSLKFDVILCNIDGGVIVRKQKHTAPPLDKIDPKFFIRYDKATHGATLHKLMDLYHLPLCIQHRVYRLIQKYWSLF